MSKRVLRLIENGDRAALVEAVRSLLRRTGGAFPRAEGGAWERYRLTGDTQALDEFHRWLLGATGDPGPRPEKLTPPEEEPTPDEPNPPQAGPAE